MYYTPDEWLAPRRVATPHDRFLDDVVKYVDPTFDDTAHARMKPADQHKLTLLVERLEFIDHLLCAVDLIVQPHKTTSVEEAPLEGGRIQRTETYSVIINGHDFAGFDFDVEAMGLYLLLTCIDTLQGQPHHTSAFDWLAGESLPDGQAYDWAELKRRYEETHGLSRNFKKAFTVDCSDELRDELIENFAVVKLGLCCVKPESVTAWEKRTKEGKIERIASQLYDIRSRFTHASLRTFASDTRVSRSWETNKPVIVQRVGGPTLRAIVHCIVRDVAVKLLIK